MNNDRRKALRALAARIESELSGLMDELKGELDSLKSEEEEYRDNMPENLQGGDKYQSADEAVSNLETAIEFFDNFEVDSITSAIEDACA